MHTQQDSPWVKILGVDVANVTQQQAIRLVESMIGRRDDRTRAVYYVNAHTLNLAAADEDYRHVLNRADCVFGDGTGVRWAARLAGVKLLDNVNGTDMMPALFRQLNDQGLSCFFLGADQAIVARAAENAQRAFPGWRLAGYHHGFVTPESSTALIERINAARPDVLLVAMGNPLQERWIDDHRDLLRVPVAMGVGGLFNFWSGNVRRAPRWLRRAGHEWLAVMFRQPHKARRYLLGNPLFLARILRARFRRYS